MDTPNIFQIATSELSQDAFIAWLASWAASELRVEDETLHATASAFVDRLLEIGNVAKPAKYSEIKVERQYKKIDVLMLINGEIAIIIEDKTNTKDHSGQLERYRRIVAKAFPGYDVAPIYLKTGDQCSYDSAEQAGYGCFLRTHFLEILEAGVRSGIRNNVFSDFARYLRELENSVQGFRTIHPENWKRPQWKGFFIALKKQLGGGDWDNRGHSGGGSLTFRWKCSDDFYLGLDRGALHFRIIVADEAQRAAKWSEWNQRLMQMNGTFGIKVKSSRPRLGNRMKVAVLDRDYRTVSEGRLDLDATIETLRKAKALMDAALKIT
jgi:hypothetical protein